MQYIVSWAGVFLLVTSPTLAFGQDTVEQGIDESAQEGEVVVITGQKYEEKAILSSTTIDGEALERTRGESFSEALAGVPGVSQLRSGSGMSKPIVRGQYGRRLLLLVDSVPHRSQEWGLDHSPEIDPFSAGEIKVVRGAAGVRYGPGAIGGAILVEEPKLLQAPGIASELHLMGYWDRGGGFAARVQSASEKFPGLAFQIDATGKKLASSSTPDYALQNTASQEWNVGGTLGYKFSDAEYTLSARHYQAKLGVCACLQIESSEDFFAQLERQRPINSELFESDFEIGRPYQSVAHDQLHARATWSLAERGSLSASYALQFDHRKEFAQVRNATGPQFDFRLTTHDAELAWEHRPAHLNDEWHLRGSVGAVGVAQLHSYRGLPLVPDYLATGGGVFAIERLLSDTYELEVGLRYDYLSRRADLLRNDFLRLVRSEQLSPTSCGGSEGGSVSCDSSFHTVSASIGGLIELAESWSLKLDVSTATRPPSPDEQYLNGTSPTFPVLALGKPDIGAETTYSTSLTSVYRGSKFALESSVYANLISDYINFAPALDEMNQPIFDVLIRGTFPRFTTTAVDALFYGADAGALWRPSSALELGVQASLVRASNRSDGGFLVMVPSDNLRASARYTHASSDGSEKFWISSSGAYTAKQKRFDPVADLALPPDAYFLLGAEVGGATKVGNQLVKLSVHGTNLLNTRYREYTSLLRYFADQPGLQLMIRLSLHQGNK